MLLTIIARHERLFAQIQADIDSFFDRCRILPLQNRVDRSENEIGLAGRTRRVMVEVCQLAVALSYSKLDQQPFPEQLPAVDVSVLGENVFNPFGGSDQPLLFELVTDFVNSVGPPERIVVLHSVLRFDTCVPEFCFVCLSRPSHDYDVTGPETHNPMKMIASGLIPFSFRNRHVKNERQSR